VEPILLGNGTAGFLVMKPLVWLTKSFILVNKKHKTDQRNQRPWLSNPLVLFDGTAGLFDGLS
jgi:hypothetical protein